MLVLRDYQQKLDNDIVQAWSEGHRNILVQLGTGGGKTSIMSNRLLEHSGCSGVLVHRNKLIEQISLTLGRYKIRHGLICSAKVKRIITRKHIEQFGQSYLFDQSACRLIAVDAWPSNQAANAAWAASVTLWETDEGHHVLRSNKWGRMLECFSHPECRGLIFTATPERGDGQGLGREAAGLADAMVEGPSNRWLIDNGYLVDYKVYAPPSNLIVAGHSHGNDFSKKQLKEASEKSTIVGDVAKHYLKFASGKSGITFTTDVETAEKIVNSYRLAGVSAELITGKTDENLRDDIFDRLLRGELKQIVAIDVISEGVDIPGLQSGALCRPTDSLGLWLQQIGRMLRPNFSSGFDLSTKEGRLAAIAASDKPHAIIIDHVNGFINPKLGPPDKLRKWTLDGRKKQERDPDDIPLKTCVECFEPYPSRMRICPHCGYQPEPENRSTPEAVDGDLELLSPDILNQLRGAVEQIDIDRYDFEAQQLQKGASPDWLNRQWRDHVKNRSAVEYLRLEMDKWAGRHHAAGNSDSEIQRAFFLRFGTDVLTAQTLKHKEATKLANIIGNDNARI